MPRQDGSKPVYTDVLRNISTGKQHLSYLKKGNHKAAFFFTYQKHWIEELDSN